ncbi:MAG TPA: hypothetical protein VK196_01750 [Magnetospirillum sp.]|nr:hypothetical protein [Magnetospirillum sp.]
MNQTTITLERMDEIANGLPLGGLGLPLAEAAATGDCCSVLAHLGEAMRAPALTCGASFTAISADTFFVPLDIWMDQIGPLLGSKRAIMEMALPRVRPPVSSATWVTNAHLEDFLHAVRTGQLTAPTPVVAVEEAERCEAGNISPAPVTQATLRTFLGDDTLADAVIGRLSFDGEGDTATCAPAEVGAVLADIIGHPSGDARAIDVRVGRLVPKSAWTRAFTLALGDEGRDDLPALETRARNTFPIIPPEGLSEPVAWSVHLDAMIDETCRALGAAGGTA